MAAVLDHFMEFHSVHGTNVRLDPSRTQATRVESFANGVCFSKDPLSPGEIFLVEIEEKELGWCGHLRIGLTAHDPRTLETVPEYSLPNLVDMGDSWVFAITRNHNKVIEEEVEGGEQPNVGFEAENKPKRFFTDTHLCIETWAYPETSWWDAVDPGDSVTSWMICTKPTLYPPLLAAVG